MTIKINSTTDTPESVTAALGSLAEATEITDTEVLDTKAASPAKDDEIADESDTSENEDSSKPKKKGGFQKRIDKLTSKATLLEQEKEYWREQALRNKSSDEVKPKADAKSDGKPKADDFESHDEYLEAFVDWKADQKLSARDQKLRETEIKSEQQKIHESYQKREFTFKKAHTDFDEVMEDVDDVPLSLTVREILLSSENGPELAYELAKNKGELERICALPAIAAARELGKFESRLAKNEIEVKPKQAKNPAPIKPVGSSGTATPKKSLSDPNLSQREYERLRDEQTAKRA